MRDSSKAAVTIGALAGGLLTYYFVRLRPWAPIKKVLAVVGGVAGGGAVGYGISRIPAGKSRGYQVAGVRSYGEFRSNPETLRESAGDLPAKSAEQRCRRRGKNICLRPDDALRGQMLQWVELVRTPKLTGEWSQEITNSRELYHYLRDVARSPQENLYAVLLNGRNAPVGHVLVARGSKSETTVSPDDILRPALLAGASRIAIAHNHPSGSLTPSAEDVALTTRVEAAGKVLNVQLLDHLIVGDRGYTSLRDVGLMA
jgi:hypothetical protein